MAASDRPDAPEVLVVDTNVILDFVSAHDLFHEAELGGTNLEYRRERARSALLLACFCHEKRIQTLSLEEVITKLVQIVPPESHGVEVGFVSLVVNFLLDHVLYDWQFMRIKNTDHLSRTPADDEYLRVAKTEGLTLVTNEGLTPGGVQTPPRPRSLRGKAMAASVPVYTAAEILADHGADFTALAAGFFDRWDEAAPRYVAEYRGKFRGVDVAEAMRVARAIYEWVLAAGFDAT